ncbi:MAG: helix-turn-helix domain-containing protein [Defluviitaleaceae bacterium]|nr:helix-turn-helix domain-containing protein [Defluviitaleaceae bacterium]
MNIGRVIKEERNKLSLSQEELGERVYVTRQTISSWENSKSYPDLHSLILLSQVFDMTVDNLVKGDLQIMEQKIEQNDIKKLKRSANIMAIFLVIAIGAFIATWNLSFIPLIPGLVVTFALFAISQYFGMKAEKIKKQYDVQTFKEIAAFNKGETLDEIAKARESGKRGYQKVLIIIAALILGASLPWWFGGFGGFF